MLARRWPRLRQCGRWARPNACGSVPLVVPVRAQPVAMPVEDLVRTVPLVSPLRGGMVTGSIDVIVRLGSTALPERPAPMAPRPRPPEPLGELPGPPSLDGLAPDGSDEPPWPEEARAEVVREVAASTPQVSAAPDQVLHVRFGRAPQDRVAAAFGTLRDAFADHPGETRVVLHIPVSPGRAQEMPLRLGVAYDTELLADVHRRLGVGGGARAA